MCYLTRMMGWDACTLEPNALLRWIECHPATAAWAQAIGIVVTIAATAVIARWSILSEKTRAREEKEGRALVLAARLAPVVYELESACFRTLRFIADNASGFDMVQDIKGVEIALRIPISLPDDVLPRLDALNANDAGIIGALHHSLWRYNSFVEAEVPKLRMMNGEERAAYSEQLDSNLAAVTVMANATSRALAALLQNSEPQFGARG